MFEFKSNSRRLWRLRGVKALVLFLVVLGGGVAGYSLLQWWVGYREAAQRVKLDTVPCLGEVYFQVIEPVNASTDDPRSARWKQQQEVRRIAESRWEDMAPEEFSALIHQLIASDKCGRSWVRDIVLTEFVLIASKRGDEARLRELLILDPFEMLSPDWPLEAELLLKVSDDVRKSRLHLLLDVAQNATTELSREANRAVLVRCFADVVPLGMIRLESTRLVHDPKSEAISDSEMILRIRRFVDTRWDEIECDPDYIDKLNWATADLLPSIFRFKKKPE